MNAALRGSDAGDNKRREDPGGGAVPVSAPFAIDEAIASWKQAMRTQVAQYFRCLREQGVSPVKFHKVKGRSFVELTIEGVRFKGQVRKGPIISGLGADCPLASASITFCADDSWGQSASRWAICNHRTQRRIALDILSMAGIRALACEFGLVIHGEGPSEMLSESECFVNSTAYDQLQAWIMKYPLLANRLLLEFPEFLGDARNNEDLRPRSRYRKLWEFQYLANP
ncbi:hypothetical protein QTH91_22080 [Variovorax dokdonensis]|uniref:Uncharacterized protein n=1 Tax=Variovorax dokdonensis TaxID=344883 RepID=A0ABT7NH03_9BURK|nr:hypothetical protein [Variovorax dokdonensis]MDM0047197.1 hypothetical protein [Variovorax dokdonensis]